MDRNSDNSDDELLSDLQDNDDAVENNRSKPFFRHSDRKVYSKYESLDYEICDSELYQQDTKFHESHFGYHKDVARWLLFIVIGIMTALVACFVDISIDKISKWKYGFLKKVVDDSVPNGDLLSPYVYYAGISAALVSIGAVLVAYVEPVAGGSGVPLVKCYLNGVNVPRIVRIKTLFVKVVGVISAVTGSLAGGKEGPMIHTGSVIAAGISQGKSTTFRRDFGILRYFRDDHEKRDFVVGGASAGVSAAFGAPIGGVLFALEEAASFFNPILILRTVVASSISSFVLSSVLSIYHGDKTYSSLFNLGQFGDLPTSYYEIPIYVLMGCFGGLLGALWVYVNTKINIFRARFIKNKAAKVFEAMLIAILTATLACIMMFSINDCHPLDVHSTSDSVQLFCKDNEFNAVATLWFQTPEASVRALFHDPKSSHPLSTLVIFVAIYYPLSCITYGLSVSLGIFIPTLLVGAAWGRIVSELLLNIPSLHLDFIEPSKYALLGAAAQLGGVMRMTLSLTAILIETTGSITFALPLILTFTCAKWTGDLFTKGIYDTQIEVSQVPMLGWRVKRAFRSLQASHIMSTPPVCIKLQDKVSRIVEILKTYPHNGFPVVEHIDDNGNAGNLCGIILRSQLVLIIYHRYFVEREALWQQNITIETFRNEYPRYPSIEKVPIPTKDLKFSINLKMFMNRSVHSAMEFASVPKIFEMFRALGLRHLIVVDQENNVRGVITRTNFL